MTPDDGKSEDELLQEIVESLFTNGFGEHADRLVLVDSNGRDLGGWCERAVRDRLRALLSRLQAAERTVTSIATMLGWANVPPQRTLEANISALKARLQAAEGRVKAQWQPIETAPKDGRPILAIKGHYRPFVAHWEPVPFGGYFRGDGEADGVRPTHWMPLPAPPSSLTADQS